MARQSKNKKRFGKGAKVSCMIKYLHPSRLVSSTLPNTTANFRLEGCTVVGRDNKVINRKEKPVFIVHHEDFKTTDGEPEDIYALPRWFKIIEEGPSEDFFGVSSSTNGANPTNSGNAEDEEQESPAIVHEINRRGRVVESDLANLNGQVQIDDDNAPAPENIPSPEDERGTNDTFDMGWGHDGVCCRRQAEGHNTDAKLFNFGGFAGIPTLLQSFELMFPQEYIIKVIIKETNKHLKNQLTYGEFISWVGLWFFMATTTFGDRREFWSSKAIEAFEGTPYRFNAFMSRPRFEAILAALQFTDRKPPSYKDRFWEVRQMIDEWNSNMRFKFSPSWISCLDESMSKWVGKFTCPGFCCVPRKPWPLGNEYHTISCGKSGILYAMEMVEGKDTPKEAPPKDYSPLGKTVGLLLRLTRPLWGSSKVVVLDSGFCVLQGIAELRKKGVFAAALIKKRKYWPKYIDGNGIKEHFKDKEVGAVDAMKGSLNGVKVEIHCLKEPEYVMMLMSSYGTLERVGGDKKRVWTNEGGGAPIERTIKYPELVFNHFQYRDAVDAHNGSRMFPIALEETWKTNRWACRVFAFLLAVTEVNCRLLQTNLYNQPSLSQQEFRKQFAKELIHNKYISQGEERSVRKSARLSLPEHRLVSLPKNRTFKKTTIVFCKTAYIQLVCSGCSQKRVRTYCPCSPGRIICSSCFADHVRLVEI